MKKTIKLIGIITFTVIIGFTLTAAGCDNGTTGGGGNNNGDIVTKSALEGTWKCDEVSLNEETITFSGNTFTCKGPTYKGNNNIIVEAGTFTINGNTLTLIFKTHTEFDNKGNIVDFIDMGSSINTFPFSISGNKLTFIGWEGTDLVFIRQK